MGIYSLENFEKYKTYKIRPQPLRNVPNNTGRGQINYITFSWSELEPKRGIYCLDLVKDIIASTINPVLILEPTSPEWVTSHSEDCLSSFIRRVGSSLAEYKHLIGVVISTINNSNQVLAAYIGSFDYTHILADIHNSNLISYLTNNKINFGLIVKGSEENWIDCCEAFARQNLQNTWKTEPVILHVIDEECGVNLSREALRWHVGYSNLPLDVGYNIGLRRLTYPQSVTSNGALPLRFWFVNTGSSPCYRNFKLKVLLSNEDKRYEIPISAKTNSWLIGDITHNEIIHIPEMSPGAYTFSVGIFFHDNSPMHLDIQKEENVGFYELGLIEVDTNNRDYLFRIWDNYYPDGYYPLEDPKTPEFS